MDRLIALFESILPISDSDKVLIIQNTYKETVEKGEKYCEQGQTCKKMGFVLEGVFKVVRTNANGDDFIQYFTNEGHFAVALESFTNKTPSEEYIEALTKCTLITLTIGKYELLEKAVPNFPKIISRIKEKALLEKYLLKSEMFVDDAQTKYNKLVQRQPSIIQRIPQSQIASFLGITPYTLSRIRRVK
ncbi:CRP-like cAMP-binding protein [Algoriphagus sp. 4150]|uniref:Crp/Fnr family transcriptional regulator n=1 Tax=Algoriphagus sp. 4150 TaxID=2817756 RepID=UPI002863E739|nr:Crp/Fnr family transcriptional regulator [Algoriphagus sp. 4150]MDR7130581.1 CRP-like cAMP-binding protein [Algoriphagus sp. 4150]